MNIQLLRKIFTNKLLTEDEIKEISNDEEFFISLLAAGRIDVIYAILKIKQNTNYTIGGIAIFNETGSQIEDFWKDLLKIAIKKNHLETIDFIYQHFKKNIKGIDRLEILKEGIQYAIETGSLPSLTYILNYAPQMEDEAKKEPETGVAETENAIDSLSIYKDLTSDSESDDDGDHNIRFSGDHDKATPRYINYGYVGALKTDFVWNDEIKQEVLDFALDKAVEKGRIECVDFLIKSGAQIKLEMLETTIDERDIKILELLVSHKQTPEELQHLFNKIVRKAAKSLSEKNKKEAQFYFKNHLKADKKDYENKIIELMHIEYQQLLKIFSDKKDCVLNIDGTLLFFAAGAGNIDLCQQLLMNEELTEDQKAKAFKNAFDHENTSIMNLFIEKGFVANKILSTETYPSKLSTQDLFDQAVSKKNLKEAERLLRMLRDEEKENKQKPSTTRWGGSHSRQDTNSVREILNEALCLALDDYSTNLNKETREMLAFLYENGAVITSHTIKAAVHRHNIDAVQFFLERTPPTSLIDADILKKAIEKGNKDIITLLLDQCDATKIDESVVLAALKKDDIDLAKLLVNKSQNTSAEFAKLKKLIEHSAIKSKQWGLSEEDYFSYMFSDELHKQWEKTVGPTHHLNSLDLEEVKEQYSPFGFNVEVYLALLAFTKFAVVNPDRSSGLYAYKLSTLFGNAEKAWDYIERYSQSHPDSEQLIHDACLFTLPERTFWDIPSWAALAEKNDKYLRFLQLAPSVEAAISEMDSPVGILKERIRKKINANYAKLEEKYSTQYDKATESFQITLETRLPNIVKAKAKKEGIQLSDEMLKARIDEERVSQFQIRQQEKKHFVQQKIQNELAKRCDVIFNKVILKEIAVRDQIQIETLSKKEKDELLAVELKRRDISKFSYEDLQRITTSLVYSRGAENPELATYCNDAQLAEHNFNTALDAFNQRKAKDNLPTIYIDGSEIDEPNYYFTKLPIDDPRGLLLGVYTHSCQSVGSDAENVAIHATVSENDGFYVIMKKTPPKNYVIYFKSTLPSDLPNYKNSYLLVENSLYYVKYDGLVEHVPIRDMAVLTADVLPTKSDKVILTHDQVKQLTTANDDHAPRMKPNPYQDKIVCQSWAWISSGEAQEKNRSLVFDSIEMLQPEKAPSFIKFYQMAAEKALGHEFVETEEEKSIPRIITKVTLGVGGRTPRDLDQTLGLQLAKPPAQQKGKKLYHDSAEQWVLASSEELTKTLSFK